MCPLRYLISCLMCILALGVNNASSAAFDSKRLIRMGIVHAGRMTSPVLSQVETKIEGHPVVETTPLRRTIDHQKRLHPASKDVIIKDGPVIELKEPAMMIATPIPTHHQSKPVCESGKNSGWLLCEDSTGETERSEAEQICQAHGQTVWMYVPKRLARQPYSYWICAKRYGGISSWLL